MTTLAEKNGEHHVWSYDALAALAEYVEEQLTASGYPVMRQEFVVGGRSVANSEAAIIGTSRAEEIVDVGAHEDTCPGERGRL